jgi:hypothetical protein
MKLFRKKLQTKKDFGSVDPIPTVKKSRKPRKYDSVRECWGFCGFLRTSWTLFKEFSADTSIHVNLAHFSHNKITNLF